MKVFNKSKVMNFIQIASNYNIDITFEDIKNKKVIKKIDYSNINDIHRLFTSWNMDKKKLLKVFFPNRFEEVKNNIDPKGELYYNNEDSKIHWINRDRHFKLKTDNYYPRVKEFEDDIKTILKKELDKLYGYYRIDDYITDKNICNGSYRKIAFIDKPSNTKFGVLNGYDDLLY